MALGQPLLLAVWQGMLGEALWYWLCGHSIFCYRAWPRVLFQALRHVLTARSFDC